MVSPPADTLVSLGGQRVARAAADQIAKARRAKAMDQLIADTADLIDLEAATLRNSRMVRGEWTDSDKTRFRRSAFAIPASEAEVWKDLVEALTDYGPRHPDSKKPLSDRMNVGE